MDIKELLLKHEGLRLKPYKDTVGKLTIGVGRNLDDVGISKEEAMILLDNDIIKAKALLYKNLPFAERLPVDVQDVLVDMTFNMGIGGLLQFKTFLSLLSVGKYDEASIAMLQSKWAIQVKGRAVELSDIIKNA